MKCPYCQKETKKIHWNRKECNPNDLSHKDFKNQVLILLYPHINKEILYEMYITQEKSLVECSKELKCIYYHLEILCDYFNITKRKIKDANTTNRVKKIRENAYLKKYGAINPLSKGTTAYYKRNQSIKDKYGVDNIFQLQEIKEKINNTMFQMYGKLRLTNTIKSNETKNNWTKERRDEYIEKLRTSQLNMTDEQKSKRYEAWLNSLSKPKGPPNKFESAVSEILTWLGISHHFSFYVKGRQFDFRINDTNILIECQGDYWHANPLHYAPEEKIPYPGKIRIAQSIWAEDYHKLKLAQKENFHVIFIWESDFSHRSFEERCDFCLNLFEDNIFINH